MGRNHVNSNDHGKGADIFNDVPGMIEKALRKIENGIADFEDKNRGYAGFERMDLSGFDTTRKRIGHLRGTVAEFNENREHEIFRTADGGAGDPDNADKFSMFSKNTIEALERLSSVRSWHDTRDMGKMRNADWRDVSMCRKFRDGEHIQAHTFDKMAYASRKASLANDRKLASGFDKWYDQSKDLLLRIFQELTDIVEHFYETKSTILRKRRREVLAPMLPQPFNNGYDLKNEKPDNGRAARLQAARRQ